ncbi:hypothetical protein GCM10010236_60810 [Streptomyces eurythermus]|nr:hypothetical protein GCM10010236_60810 [Streptomyces eurythermus]
MHDNDGRGAGSYGRLDRARGEAVGRRVYVGEHRERARQDHGLGDLDVPEGRYDDLVTDSDSGGPEQRCGSHAGDAALGT